MATPEDRIPYDLNDEEREEYNNLGSETLKKEYLQRKEFEKIQQKKKLEEENTTEDDDEEEISEEDDDEQTEPEVIPYPTYIQEQESIKKNDWVPIPEVPFVAVFEKIYRCADHPDQSSLNRGTITQHLRAKHGIDLAGRPTPPPPQTKSNKPIIEANTEENENNENQLNSDDNQLNQLVDDENQLNQLDNQLSPKQTATLETEREIAVLKKQLREKQLAETATQVEEPEIMVMANYNAEVAASATKIVQNIDLRFMYEKTKTLWPPDWDFATWITALVTYALNDFKIGATVWQDRDSLDQQKIQFLIHVKEDWNKKIQEELNVPNSSIISKSEVRL